MPQLHPPARSTGCRPIFAAATPAAHRCRAWAHAPKTAVSRVLLHPAQTRSCAEMTAISRQAGGRTDRFVAQLAHRRAMAPRRLSPAVRPLRQLGALSAVGRRTGCLCTRTGSITVSAGQAVVGRQRRRVDSICRTAHERVPPLRARPGLAVSVLSVPRALAASADHRAASSPHELRCGCCICLLAQLLPRARRRRLLRGRRPQPRLRQRCVRLFVSVCLPVCAYVMCTLIYVATCIPK